MFVQMPSWHMFPASHSSTSMQLRPSGAGSYPWAHVQRYEPGRFSHHPGEQGLPSEHSLISRQAPPPWLR